MEPFLEFTGFSTFVSTSFVQGCRIKQVLKESGYHNSIISTIF